MRTQLQYLALLPTSWYRSANPHKLGNCCRDEPTGPNIAGRPIALLLASGETSPVGKVRLMLGLCHSCWSVEGADGRVLGTDVGWMVEMLPLSRRSRELTDLLIYILIHFWSYFPRRTCLHPTRAFKDDKSGSVGVKHLHISFKTRFKLIESM